MNSSKELFKNISLRKLCFEELTLGEYTKLWKLCFVSFWEINFRFCLPGSERHPVVTA
jgi:hypothetical protein